MRTLFYRIMPIVPPVAICVIVIAYSLSRGADYNFDFVNIKGQLAWSILHNRLGIDSLISGRYQFPQFVDIWNVLLLGTGKWWLPIVFWGIVHSLVVPITFLILRELLPVSNRIMLWFFSCASLTSPLILMQLGTGIGHITTSVFFGLSLLFVLRGMKSDDNHFWIYAGMMLGIAILLRSSSIPTIPAYFFAVSIIVVRSSQLFSFLVSFGWVYLGVSVLWALYVSNAAGVSFTGIGAVPSGIVGLFIVSCGLVLGTICFYVRDDIRSKIFKFFDRPSLFLTFRVGLIAAVLLMIRKIYLLAQTADPRFLITNFEQARQRVTHTGSLIDKCCQVDLELAYFDIRIQVLLVVILFVLGLTLINRSKKSTQTLGIVLFVALPIVMAISYSGYIRYASQALPFVPVGVVALISALSLRHKTTYIFLSLSTLLLVIPVVSFLGTVKPVPRYAQLTNSQNLMNGEELSLVNDLLPKDSFVYIAGPLTSLLAQQLNRRDLIWSQIQPTREVLSVPGRDFFVLYNPAEPKVISQLSAQWISAYECSFLRFDNLQLTVCRIGLASDFR